MWCALSKFAWFRFQNSTGFDKLSQQGKSNQQLTYPTTNKPAHDLQMSPYGPAKVAYLFSAAPTESENSTPYLNAAVIWAAA